MERLRDLLLFFMFYATLARSQTTTLEPIELETKTTSDALETTNLFKEVDVTTLESVDYRCTPQFQQERPKPKKERFIHDDCMLVEFAGYLEMKDGSGGFIELKNGRMIHQTECRYSHNNSIINIRYDNCVEIGILFKNLGHEGSYVQYIRFAHWQEDELRNLYMLLPPGLKTPSRNDHYRCDAKQALGDFPQYKFVLHLSQIEFEVFRNSSSQEYTTTPHVCLEDSPM